MPHEQLKYHSAAFVFGSDSRYAHKCLDEIERTGGRSPELLHLVKVLVGVQSLRQPFLSSLTSLQVSSELAASIGELLAAEGGWSLPESLDIASWLASSGARNWVEWLTGEMEFPSAEQYPPDIWRALSSLARQQYRDLPLTIYGDNIPVADPEPSAVERYAVARMELVNSQPDVILAVTLLSAAAACQLHSTTASIFAEGYVDTMVGNPLVQEVFHRLDWSRFGDIKFRYAQRTVLLDPVDADPMRNRMIGVQSWARGDGSKAVHYLEPLLNSSADVSPQLAREYLCSFVLTGRRARRQENELLMKIGSTPAGQCIGLLLDWSRRVSISPAEAETTANNLVLPPKTDPLFGSLARLLLPMYSLRVDLQEFWRQMEKRFDAVDPLWKSHIPFPDREYALALAAMLGAGDDPVRLVVATRRLLLLPVDLKWIRRALAYLVAGPRSLLMLESDDTPSTLGLIVNDVCIRTVASLLENQFEIPAESAAPLANGDPVVTAGILINWLFEAGRQ